MRNYSEEDKVPVTVLPGLEIDLNKVFPFQPKVVKESPGKYLAGNKQHSEASREPEPDSGKLTNREEGSRGV